MKQRIHLYSQNSVEPIEIGERYQCFIFYFLLHCLYLDLGAVDDKVLAVVGHLPVVHAVHGVVPVFTQRARPADHTNSERNGLIA